MFSYFNESNSVWYPVSNLWHSRHFFGVSLPCSRGVVLGRFAESGDHARSKAVGCRRAQVRTFDSKMAMAQALAMKLVLRILIAVLVVVVIGLGIVYYMASQACYICF